MKLTRVSRATTLSELATAHRKAASMARLRAEGRVADVEDGGMDDDRFFVHLNAEWVWNDDPAGPYRSRSFGSITAARTALRKETSRAP